MATDIQQKTNGGAYLTCLKGDNPLVHLLEIRDGYIALSALTDIFTNSTDNQLVSFGAVLEPIVEKLYSISELRL